MAVMSLISLALGYVLTIVLHRLADLHVDLAYAIAVAVPGPGVAAGPLLEVYRV